ncbi:MAG: hypothetical protein JEZ08_21590 [Clostridiales bacterium]|nr:hypothetical protein [Clostridiales bacterium]
MIYILNRKHITFDQSFGYFIQKRFNFKWTVKSVGTLHLIRKKSLTVECFDQVFVYQKITSFGIAFTLFIDLIWFLELESLIYLICICIFIVWIPDLKLKDDVKKIEREIISDLPDVIMSVKLLIGAGMTIDKALMQLEKHEGLMYELIRGVVCEFQIGQSASKVLINLSNKCQMQSVTRFSRILMTDERNGSRKTLVLLSQLCDDLWKQKKTLFLKRGEEASTKLLIPMMISLFGVIVAVTIPAVIQLFTAL